MKICKLDDLNDAEDQSCFDKHPLEVATELRIVDNNKYRARVNLGERNMTYE
jgi:hypothetical protein